MKTHPTRPDLCARRSRRRVKAAAAVSRRRERRRPQRPPPVPGGGRDGRRPHEAAAAAAAASPRRRPRRRPLLSRRRPRRRPPRGGGGRRGGRLAAARILTRVALILLPALAPTACLSTPTDRWSARSSASGRVTSSHSWARESGRSMALAGSACCSSSTSTPRIGLTRRDAVPMHTPLSARACARACMHSARRALESQARALDCLWGCDAGARVPARQQRLLPDLPASRLDLGAGQRRGCQRLLQSRWFCAVRVTVQQPQPSPVCGFH